MYNSKAKANAWARTYYAKNKARYRAYRAKQDKEHQKAYQRKYRMEHKETRQIQQHNYYLAHKAKIREQNRKYHGSASTRIRIRNRTYGITSEQVSVQFRKQGGKCAICRKVLDPNGTRATRDHVDHDHLTNKFRGLLCLTCNVGLGAFHDSLKLLRAAANYLDRNQ